MTTKPSQIAYTLFNNGVSAIIGNDVEQLIAKKCRSKKDIMTVFVRLVKSGEIVLESGINLSTSEAIARERRFAAERRCEAYEVGRRRRQDMEARQSWSAEGMGLLH